MELDKRIKELTDIQSVTNGCQDWLFMTKKGYFANSIFDFKDLKRLCEYGEYAGWREHNQCFLCEQASDETYYSYFLPEDRLLPKESKKKYRPYTTEEFIHEYAIGVSLFKIRDKREPEYIYQFLLIGYSKGLVYLGGWALSLKEFFDNYEIGEGRGSDETWHPFGVLDE